jgi:hypothetical protein
MIYEHSHLLSIRWLKPPALAGDFDLYFLNHARLGGSGFDDFNHQHPNCANPPALAGGSLVNIRYLWKGYYSIKWFLIA